MSHFFGQNRIQKFLKVLCISTLIIFFDQNASKQYANAFAPSQKLQYRHRLTIVSNIRTERIEKNLSVFKTNLHFKSSSLILSSSNDSNGDVKNVDTYSYTNVSWKIKPWLKINEADKSVVRKTLSKLSNLKERIVLRGAANLIRLDCKIKGETPPKVLCPKGGQAVLEAYAKREKGIGSLLPFKKKIARFGITTHRGPPAPQMRSTIQQLYNITVDVDPGVAAIIYMYVEPEYRSTGLGELALNVISSIHAFQRCDFTILVADDNGSGKLVEWYLTHGFEKAPLLQDMMGSPGGKFGTTMIRPSSISPDFFDECKLRWW